MTMNELTKISPMHLEQKHKFLFSVVLAVYNTEEYLGEALDSVISQTIGFEDNIQIILVNDGSTDSSGEICQRYAERYPQNIVYLIQKNAGVSAARNAGLAQATGLYINFMDSDDKWSHDAFSEVKRFFRKHPDVGMASCRIEFFDKRSGAHPLDYVFKHERVVDLLSEPDCLNTHVNSGFFSRQLLGETPFDSSLSVGEDMMAIAMMLLREPRYGVLKKPIYWYRKRSAMDSALDRSLSNVSYYTASMELFLKRILDLSEQMYGRLLPFVQYTVMYDLQWRFKKHFLSFPFSEEMREEYKVKFRSCISRIDDAIIISQRNIDRCLKLASLAFKYGLSISDLQRRLVMMYGKVMVELPSGGLVSLWRERFETRVDLLFFERKGSYFRIEGRLYTIFPKEKIRIIVKGNKFSKEAELFERINIKRDTIFDEDIYKPIGFVVTLPLKSFTFIFKLCDRIIKPNFKTGKFFPFSQINKCYAAFDDISVRWNAPRFSVRHCSHLRYLVREIKHNLSLCTTKYDSSLSTEKDNQTISKTHQLRLRTQVFLSRVLFNSRHKKRIWLISDRTNLAGDNGEALFSYLMAHPQQGVKPYFLLRADSPDFERMKRIGPVVPYFSEQHRRLWGVADKIISSAGEDDVFFSFPEEVQALTGLGRPDFVFLQHGITKDDISSWLNRWNKNLKLFCTAAPREFESIVGNDSYGYTEKQVRLTGFARHDALLAAAKTHVTEKIILIIPTWRQWLANERVVGVRSYSTTLKQSGFFAFYNRLLHDSDIAECARKAGYSGHFLLHPAFISNIQDFSSSWCEILDRYEYREEFLSSAIALTDYSSAIMDFAILQKPIIYAQFDESEFFSKHLYKRGYYDYRRDGFGPVCSTYEEVKSELLKMIEAPVMLPEYRSRVECFFGPLDGHACERITQALLNMDKE